MGKNVERSQISKSASAIFKYDFKMIGKEPLRTN